MASRRNRYAAIAAAAALLLTASGCASLPDPYENTFEPYVHPVHGHVVRVNTADAYVVLECTVLPSAGEEITLYRSEQAVARVLVTPDRNGPFIAADIVEGTPITGDWFRGTNRGHVPQQRR